MKTQVRKSASRKTKPAIKKSTKSIKKFSPVWVLDEAKDAPGYKLDIIKRIRAGVKKTEWKQLIKRIGYTEKEMENILPTSISSMQKKLTYSKETSERIYELAKLFGIGYEIFDTEDQFNLWLQSPSKALGGKIPFDLLDSSFGFEIVENEINRIKYNVYS